MAEQYELNRSEVIREYSITLMIPAVKSPFPGLPKEYEISKSRLFISLRYFNSKVFYNSNYIYWIRICLRAMIVW